MIKKRILLKNVFVLFFLFAVLIPDYGFSQDIHVPADYESIQTAITEATEGDVIWVADGIYPENVSINKALTLISENGYQRCTVKAAVDDDVIKILADDVTIEGFTISGTNGLYASGINIASGQDCKVKYNQCNSAWGGIAVKTSGNIIAGNVCSKNGFGIYLNDSATSNQIIGNTCMANGRGIYVLDDNNIINGNTCYKNMVDGISLNHTEGNSLTGNTITDNKGRGIDNISPANSFVDNFSRGNRGEPPVNVALGKSTLQSSNNFGTTGAEAVDGNLGGDFGAGEVTCTHPDNATWWQVDLERKSNIDYVKIYNRTDCCEERLADFYLEVSDDGINWQTALHYPDVIGDNMGFSLFGISARYFRIRLNNPNYLSLAEVQVWENWLRW